MVQLTLCTYNIRGFNFTKVKYIKDLLKLCTIVVLQELWLNDHQISELSSRFQGYNAHGVSAIDSSILLKGRPKGGVAFIYHDILGEVSLIKTKYDCINCTNVFCNNNEHAASIQQMHDDIISACIDASDNIPITKKNRKNLPGWNKFVRPEKEKALFWRSIWINNGSPRQGYVADIMRRTRAKYHYAIKRIRNNSQLIKKRVMARVVTQKCSRQLRTEVRKLRDCKSNLANCIDKKTGSESVTHDV